MPGDLNALLTFSTSCVGIWPNSLAHLWCSLLRTSEKTDPIVYIVSEQMVLLNFFLCLSLLLNIFNIQLWGGWGEITTSLYLLVLLCIHDILNHTSLIA